jgi:hypothetical protein
MRQGLEAALAACFELGRPSVVGLGRFELPTSRLSGGRSDQLSYRPVSAFESQTEPHRFGTQQTAPVSKN